MCYKTLKKTIPGVLQDIQKIIENSLDNRMILERWNKF